MILLCNENVLFTSVLQFGFKRNTLPHSVRDAIDEVVNYYNTAGSDVFTMFLDATKGFDCVNYIKLYLFRILIDKGLRPLECKFFADMYSNNRKSKVMDNFKVTNGVKQGGVLSPVLVGVYISTCP